MLHKTRRGQAAPELNEEHGEGAVGYLAEEEVVCCTNLDDEGHTIQCKNCNRWQHIACAQVSLEQWMTLDALDDEETADTLLWDNVRTIIPLENRIRN